MSGTDVPPVFGQNQEAVLRRLFRMLLFRGRRRGKKEPANSDPKHQFLLALIGFGFISLVALFYSDLDDFAFAAVLHSQTLVMIGMNLALSGGTLLFNPEESEVLLHRPIDPRLLLRAKLYVIVEFTVCLALALNLCGFFVGIFSKGSWLFLPAHFIALVLSVLFCASSVVLLYNLCLRWLGRRRLDSVMTTLQVLLVLGITVGSRAIPLLANQVDPAFFRNPPAWIFALPPAWFAAVDVLLSARGFSLQLAALAMLGVGATALVTWLSVSLLAEAYQQGLAILNEAGPAPVAREKRRAAGWLARLPGICLWLRDPVERAVFNLVIAGLTRARDVKLRIYPVLGQLLVAPVMMFVGSGSATGSPWIQSGSIAFAAAYLSFVPVLLIEQLRMSDNFAATEVFYQTPLVRPAALYHGTRKALIFLLCAPSIALLVIGLWLWFGSMPKLSLLLPGVILLPLVSRIPGAISSYIPFSEPPKASRCVMGCFFVALFFAGASIVSALAMWSELTGWFHWMLLGEALVVAAASWSVHQRIETQRLELET